MKRLGVLFFAVSLFALLSGCATVANVSRDVVMAPVHVVAGEAQAVGDLAQGAVEKPWHATLWNVLVFPVKAAKVGVDSVWKSLGDIAGHLHGH